jgi:hypothetical protein
VFLDVRCVTKYFLTHQLCLRPFLRPNPPKSAMPEHQTRLGDSMARLLRRALSDFGGKARLPCYQNAPCTTVAQKASTSPKNMPHKWGKRIETIPAGTMQALMSWCWPGNVRELENFIERSVILSPGLRLCAPLAEIRKNKTDVVSSGTLEEVEREYELRQTRQALPFSPDHFEIEGPRHCVRCR